MEEVAIRATRRVDHVVPLLLLLLFLPIVLWWCRSPLPLAYLTMLMTKLLQVVSCVQSRPFRGRLRSLVTPKQLAGVPLLFGERCPYLGPDHPVSHPYPHSLQTSRCP